VRYVPLNVHIDMFVSFHVFAMVSAERTILLKYLKILLDNFIELSK